MSRQDREIMLQICIQNAVHAWRKKDPPAAIARVLGTKKKEDE